MYKGDCIKIKSLHPQNNYFEMAIKRGGVQEGRIYRVAEVNEEEGWFDIVGDNDIAVTCYLNSDMDIDYEVCKIQGCSVGDYVIIDKIITDEEGWNSWNVYAGKAYKIAYLDLDFETKEIDGLYIDTRDEDEPLLFLEDDPDFVFRIVKAEDIGNKLTKPPVATKSNLKVEELVNIVGVDLEKRIEVNSYYLVEYCPNVEERYNTLTKKMIDCLCEVVALNNIVKEKRDIVNDILSEIEKQKNDLEGVDLYYEN